MTFCPKGGAASLGIFMVRTAMWSCSERSDDVGQFGDDLDFHVQVRAHEGGDLDARRGRRRKPVVRLCTNMAGSNQGGHICRVNDLLNDALQGQLVYAQYFRQGAIDLT